MTSGDIFPFSESSERLDRYDRFSKLLNGKHYEAFAIAATEFSKQYERLRYITVNLASLTSKIMAHMLFGEEVVVKSEKNQDWLNNLWFKNRMKTVNYESALTNSARGDALYRIRVEEREIIIDSLNPALYFPVINNMQFNSRPRTERIAWKETYQNGDKVEAFVVFEIHTFGNVATEVYELKEDKSLGNKQDLKTYNEKYSQNYIESVDTGLKDRTLLFHVPNYRDDFEYFGTSDYQDIESIIFAINNRLTKNDNVLDKHTDPILAVPPGILDEDGKVQKSALGMIEMGEDGSGKPEYIVWNANLDSAYKQVEKLIDAYFITSEINPDAVGMGKNGVAESGRALKFRLLRTIAKKDAKLLYYDQALKEVLVTAQMLSNSVGATVSGEKAPDVIKDSSGLTLIWPDGVMNDDKETVENETMKLEAGLTSKKRAVMVIENANEEEADNILKEVKLDEQASADLQKEFFGQSTTNNQQNNNSGNQNNNGQQTQAS